MDVFLFKHKTAYDMRISDWSSDVCSSDLSTSAAAPPASKRRRCGERSGMNGLQFERVGLGRALAMGDAEQRGDEEQGRGGGEDQPADHRAAERGVLLGAFADAEIGRAHV